MNMCIAHQLERKVKAIHCTCAVYMDIHFLQDLKKYNFYYWFVFPALFPEQPVTSDKAVPLGSIWSKEQVLCFFTECLLKI